MKVLLIAYDNDSHISFFRQDWYMLYQQLGKQGMK
ncbi:hypothetical protein IMSAGC011_01411 [Lachnospiraceae bacterium]|nr:hypothetical protein IMSAGC011_01411 [Lachnospiraceae bacterium]